MFGSMSGFLNFPFGDSESVPIGSSVVPFVGYNLETYSKVYPGKELQWSPWALNPEP